MAITVDATSNSGVKAGVSSFTFNHTVASGSDRLISIQIMQRDGSLADIGATAVSFNSVAATKAIAREGAFHAGNFGSEIWLLPAPDVGTFSVSVTLPGTSDHAYATALSVFGALQSTTPDVTGSGLTNTFDVDDPSVAVTTTVDDCLVIDAVMDVTDLGNLTVGADQTTISSQGGTNGGGDTAASSYEQAGVAGSQTMSWTTPGAGAGMDAWVSAVCAIQPSVSAGIRSLRQVVGHGQGTRS